MLEILFCLVTGDFEKADSTSIYQRTYFLDYTFTPDHTGKAVMDMVQEIPPPRVMKTHLPASFFNRQLVEDRPKTVILLRNPKDLLVSYYHYYRMSKSLGLFPGSWNEFFELVKDKRLMFGDYFDWCCSWWPMRHEDNVLVIKYEDMVRDLPRCVLALAAFCGRDISHATLSRILQRGSFEAMKKNPKTNMTEFKALRHEISPFFRKGIIGDWHNYFTEEQNQYIEEQYRGRCLPLGLHFDFGESKL